MFHIYIYAIFHQKDTAKIFFYSVSTVLMLIFFWDGEVHWQFPMVGQFTVEKLIAEHVEFPNLAF